LSASPLKPFGQTERPEWRRGVRTLATIIVMVSIDLSGPLQGQARVDRMKAATLADAIQLAGPAAAALPIVLAEKPYQEPAAGIEAWTFYDHDGRPRQIFVYTGSAAFRCANQINADRQCRLRLASIIVHEAWHFTRSRDDGQAYDEQLAFLMVNGASSAVIGSVRRSRTYALARQRKPPAVMTIEMMDIGR
jgi:hypothetical protein